MSVLWWWKALASLNGPPSLLQYHDKYKTEDSTKISNLLGVSFRSTVIQVSTCPDRTLQVTGGSSSVNIGMCSKFRDLGIVVASVKHRYYAGTAGFCFHLYLGYRFAEFHLFIILAFG